VNQGLFLVNGAGTVKVSEFLSNAPSELMFVLDDTLPVGDYTPEVRAIAKGSTELRTGRMSTKLVVS